MQMGGSPAPPQRPRQGPEVRCASGNNPQKSSRRLRSDSMRRAQDCIPVPGISLVPLVHGIFASWQRPDRKCCRTPPPAALLRVGQRGDAPPNRQAARAKMMDQMNSRSANGLDCEDAEVQKDPERAPNCQRKLGVRDGWAQELQGRARCNTGCVTFRIAVCKVVRAPASFFCADISPSAQTPDGARAAV